MLHTRLEQLARWLLLLAEQCAALENGDVARFEAAARERAELEQELRPHDPAEPDDIEAGGDSELARADAWVQAALARVDRDWPAACELRRQLNALCEVALPHVRGLGPPRPGRGSYREPGLAGERLNVRL